MLKHYNWGVKKWIEKTGTGLHLPTGSDDTFPSAWKAWAEAFRSLFTK